MTVAKAVLPPVHVRTLGAGVRKVLALHCTIAHSGAWSGLASALGEQATLTAPDMLSHGRSPDWDGQGDFFDLTTALSREQLSEPMDVIGHSFGAMVALRLAIEYPDLVRGAVLIEPVFFAVAHQDAPALAAQHAAESQPYKAALAEGDAPRAARLFNRMWGTTDRSPRWPDLPERTRNAMIRGVGVVGAVEGPLFRDTTGLLAPTAMARADMPILLLHGSASHPIMAVVNAGLCDRLPNARQGVVEGAGHMLPISHPGETAAQIDAFWRA
ncbi:alpha/beta fold hydrolase [Ruegeria arenilitoris]|uniref:Haloalkane dehalogenase n=1 Tax=Ruegeria arenilitoris TaxID=1173585 RepID=A0A238KY68_9RHOB|nr:alpha/beta hydrolase [Ruegeria arenilitoris]SMX47667.1 haloalkane dehalogenase [Ruegeria arenilitoris]